METSYYISCTENDAELFAYAAQGHWSIENNLHWVLDIVFREYGSRIRKENATENFIVLRHIV